ncbi:MAG TPA: pyridoxamine 5'-phosphate oxidase family protein [Actinomycetota bacterium]|jgi:general stress protein 26
MDEPTTELDERFSAPGADTVPWSTARKLLESAQLSWITTVRADGRPHVTPLVAVWVDDALHFATGESEQKAMNLAANPHVVLTTGCNTWDQGIDVMVEGEALRVTEQAMLVRLAAAWATRWNGEWQYNVVEGGFAHDQGPNAGAGQLVLVFQVAATKILAFGKDPFSHTRYRLDR